MIALAAMQGLGKPGCNIWSTTHGVPCDTSLWFPGYSEGGISNDPSTASGFRLANRMWPNGAPPGNPQHSTEGQTVSRLRIPEAMMHEHHEWRGKGFCGSSIESQFQKYEYPAPGYSPVGMYYKYGSSFIGTMTETNRYVRAYREGQVPVRGQPVHLVRRGDPVRRHHPAGLHQLRALGHRRVGKCQRSWGPWSPSVQPPADRASRTSASNRWASRSPTTRSSRFWPNVSVSDGSTRRAAPISTGSSASSRRATFPAASPGRSSRRRATTWCRRHPTESRLRP